MVMLFFDKSLENIKYCQVLYDNVQNRAYIGYKPVFPHTNNSNIDVNKLMLEYYWHKSNSKEQAISAEIEIENFDQTSFQFLFSAYKICCTTLS